MTAPATTGTVVFTAPPLVGFYAVSLTAITPDNFLPQCFVATGRITTGFTVENRDCATGRLTPLNDTVEVTYIAIPYA